VWPATRTITVTASGPNCAGTKTVTDAERSTSAQNPLPSVLRIEERFHGRSSATAIDLASEFPRARTRGAHKPLPSATVAAQKSLPVPGFVGQKTTRVQHAASLQAVKHGGFRRKACEFLDRLVRRRTSKSAFSICFGERFVCLLKDKNPPTN
jgi:hypothetical protein